MARQQSKKSNNGNAKAKKPKRTSGQTSSKPATGSTGRSKTNSRTTSTTCKTRTTTAKTARTPSSTRATTRKSSSTNTKTTQATGKTTRPAAKTPTAKGKKAAITARKTERTVGRTGETVPMTKSAAEVTCGIKPTFERIQHRAYEIYLARGATPGDPTSDWLQAERELRESRSI